MFIFFKYMYLRPFHVWHQKVERIIKRPLNGMLALLLALLVDDPPLLDTQCVPLAFAFARFTKLQIKY